MINIHETILTFSNSRILCVPHINPDLDAIASAYIIQKLYNADIGVFGKISEFAQKFIDKFGVRSIENPKTENYDLIILVDNSEKTQFAPVNNDNIIIFDHHLSNATYPFKNVLHKIIRDRGTYNSCTLVIYEYMKINNLEITPKVSSAIIAGFLGDIDFINASNYSRSLIEEIVDRSLFTISELDKLCKHNSLYEEKKIERMCLLLNELEYHTINGLKLVFLYPKSRSDFFFLHDHLFRMIDFDAIFTIIYQDGINVCRIEKSSKKFDEMIVKDLFWENLQNNLDPSIIIPEWNKFGTLQENSFIKSKLIDLISSTDDKQKIV